MVTPNPRDAEPLPAEEGSAPDLMPTDGDKPREIGKRAHDDVSSPRKDTDLEGLESQRKRAPHDAPTRRSDDADEIDEIDKTGDR